MVIASARASIEAGRRGEPSADGLKRIGSFRDLLKLLREDRAINRGSILSPGFQAIAVHRFGVWARGLDGKISRRVFRRLYLIINWFSRGFHGIELPARAHVGRRLLIAHQGGIVIHGRAVIGDDCLIRHNTTIGALGSGPDMPVPRVGNRVEIGAGAVLLGGITVGDGSVIGANAVVRCDVPPDAVVFPPEASVVIRRSARPAGSIAPALCVFLFATALIEA